MTPEGWDCCTLAEISELSGGTTPSKTVPEFWDGEIHWATPSDVTALPQSAMYISETRSKITQKAVEETSLCILKPGCVLMTSRATIGEAVINRVPMATNQGFCNFVPRRNLEPMFLAYWLRASKSKLVSLSGGSTFLEIGKRTLRGLSITLPPLTEQKKIAAILGSVDEAIASTQVVIDQTRKVKQGLLAQLLTRGIGHTRFKKTEIGEIPEAWEVQSVSDLCSVVSVGIVVKPTKYYVESGVPCFRSANVREGYINDRDWVYISDESNQLHSKSKLQAGDVLIVRTGYPGTSCVVSPEFDGSNCVDIVFARPNSKTVLPHFLSWFVNSPAGKKQIAERQGGLAQQHFNVGAFKQMMVALPTIQEQHRILEGIGTIQDRLIDGELEISRLNSVKRGLMQDLLTGRVRVKGVA